MGFKDVCWDGISIEMMSLPIGTLGISIAELTVSATRHFMGELCWHLGQEPSEHTQVTQ